MTCDSFAKSGCRTTNCTGCPNPPNAGGLLAKISGPGIPKYCPCTSAMTSCTLRRGPASVSRVKMSPRLGEPVNPPTTLK